MIFTENIEIDGKVFVRTYSDTYTIKRDGVEYGDAVDPIGVDRVYVETENRLPIPEEESDENLEETP